MVSDSFVTFDSFSKTGIVRHCFSTRIGGHSTGAFESLNLGLSRGDDRHTVLENYRILAEQVGFHTSDMVFSNQVHGVRIYDVDEKDKGRFSDCNHIKEVDGLITDKPNVVLVTFYADCVPIFLLDPIKRVIAVAHGGWRGTVNEIARISVEKMVADYSCKPENILAGIGPSIGKCCFEVDEEVADEFLKLPEASPYVYKEPNWEFTKKSRIDLWQVNKSILQKAGVPPQNIEISALCTKCKEELFYSHRRSGNLRGSMAAFLELIN